MIILRNRTDKTWFNTYVPEYPDKIFQGIYLTDELSILPNLLVQALSSPYTLHTRHAG
jgi:hypothetical protein